MLLHVEGQLLGLAGEHLRQFEEVEEEHELQVLTRQALALLRGRFGAGGAFTGAVDGHPVGFHRAGQCDDGGHQIRRARGDDGEQGLQMHLQLVIPAGVEDAAAFRQRFDQDRGSAAIRGDEPGLDPLHGRRQGVLAEIRFRLLARLADAEAHLIIRGAVFHQPERTRGGRDARGQLPARIVRAHALNMIRDKSDQAADADLRIVKRIPQEGSQVSHRTTGLCIDRIKTHAGIEEGKSVARHDVEDAGLNEFQGLFIENARQSREISELRPTDATQ